MAISHNVRLFISHCKNAMKLSDYVIKYFSNIAHKHNLRNDKHVYNTISRWKSKRELADYLLENILFNKDGLIVINKPYGIGAQPPRDNGHRYTSRISDYSLYDVLPYIGNSLGEENLMVAKSGEKYSSGVSVLVTSEKLIAKLNTCKRRDMCAKKLTSKYLCVVLGQPKNTKKKESVNVALSVSPDGKNIQPIIYDVKKPENIKQWRSVEVMYNTICTNGYGTSLVEISANTTKWHFLRVYLAHQLSPVLGDDIHGSRVTNCMGVPTEVNPFNLLRQRKVISSAIRHHLDIEQGEEDVIPCHIHLQEVTFTMWNKDRSDVTVKAPTPPFFDWTCEQLNLKGGHHLQLY